MKVRNGIAITFAAAGASLALAGAVLAHPHEGGDGKEKIQKVIVLNGKHDGKDGEKRVREFRVLRGEGGELRCPDGDATKIDETTDGDRTKILICGGDKVSGADRAKKLEEALARIRSHDHMGAEHKAKVEAALQDAIARLRATN